ncbi:hypothetical protein SETIT_9G007600v2 [Setaria italica]|uniref:Uncharacterized protein n=1 Tax=Setaria italica TaxID=4555 RepID=A0A368SC07_SETIT|nr:hypothetical protein SETIT_9G007600v2 [Setaria italica]
MTGAQIQVPMARFSSLNPLYSAARPSSCQSCSVSFFPRPRNQSLNPSVATTLR